MTISVIIPSRTASNLIPCVEAARQHEPEARIIVVDDGLDADCILSRARSWQPFEIVIGAAPFIFARNVNLGIRAAGDDDLVLLNDDALLQTPHGFTKLAAFADAHPEVGCVAPSTNVTGQVLQWPKYRTLEGWRYVETVPYVCVYIPRRTIERVGLLDERYCLDYGVEDLDHTTAMQRAGLKVAILYDVFVDHGSLRSSFRGDPHAPKSFAKNYALYKQKWGICGSR